MSFSPLYFYNANLFLTYAIGFIISLFVLRGEYFYYSLGVAFIISISTLFFNLGWFVTTKIRIVPLSYPQTSKISYLFTLIFILTASYIYYKTPPALLASFMGSEYTVSELRAMATKGKSGIDSFINGFFYASSYIGLGFFVLLAFYKNFRLKWLVLLGSILLVMLNGQKSRFLIPLLPVIFLYIQRGNFKLVNGLLIIGSSTLIIALIALNFTGGEYSSLSNLDTQERVTQGGRDLFEQRTSVSFIIHRIFWIPYITAIDWLRYIDTSLHEYLMGASIPVFSNLIGVDRVNLDNAVFKFQYDVSYKSLGSANSFFAFDAIANFGYGVLLVLPVMLGMVFATIWKGLPEPFNLMIFVWLFSFQSSSFHALFLGGGMFIVFFLILLKNILSLAVTTPQQHSK